MKRHIVLFAALMCVLQYVGGVTNRHQGSDPPGKEADVARAGLSPCMHILSIPQYDVWITHIAGLNDGCDIGPDTISIWIRNIGVDSINVPGASNITASYQLNGELPVVTEQVTQVIMPNDSVLFHFNTLAYFVAGAQDSVYHVVAWVDLQGDTVKHNDTAMTVVTSLHKPDPPVVPGVIVIPYATSALLTATSATNDSILWYTTPTGGFFFHMGNTYATQPVYSDTTLYVEAMGAIPPQTFNLGTGHLANTTTTYPTPYGNWYWGNREQYLLLASELTALGMVAGEISSLTFEVLMPQGAGLQNFTIKMGHTSVTSMTDTFIATSMTTVYFHPSYVDVKGLNTHEFQTSFHWDGTNNLVVEVCFNNSTFTQNGVVRQTATPFPSVTRYNADTSGVCSTATGIASSQRPNIWLAIGAKPCTSARIPLFLTCGCNVCDVGLNTILEPASKMNLGTQEDLKVRIKNYGSSSQTNIPVTYQVNLQQPVTEIIPAIVPSYGFTDYTFATKVDLNSVGDTYQIKAWTALACDPKPQNDTAWKMVTNLMPPYCKSAATGTGNQDLTNVTLHTLNNTSLPTGSVYTDFTTMVPPPDLSTGVAYPMSISTDFSSEDSTQYACWVSAWIDINRDGIFDPANELIFSSSTTSSATVTDTVTLPPTALEGNTLMRVVLQESGTATTTTPCGIYSLGETEDYVVTITPQVTCDVGVTRIIAPLPDSLDRICAYSLWQPFYQYPVKVRISNFGQNTQTSIPLLYTFYNGGPVNSDTWTGTLAQGDSTEFILAILFQPMIGLQQMCVETDLTGDSITGNNMACKNYRGVYCYGGIDDLEGNGFILMQNIPNPAKGTTLIGYQVPRGGNVTFCIANLVGQVIHSEIRSVPAGQHQLELDVSKLAAGVYYYFAEFNGQRLTRKLVVSW